MSLHDGVEYVELTQVSPPLSPSFRAFRRRFLPIAGLAKGWGRVRSLMALPVLAPPTPPASPDSIQAGIQYAYDCARPRPRRQKRSTTANSQQSDSPNTPKHLRPSTSPPSERTPSTEQSDTSSTLRDDAETDSKVEKLDDSVVTSKRNACQVVLKHLFVLTSSIAS
jgi:hypothetical protein